MLKSLLNAVTESEVWSNISKDKLVSYQLDADKLLKDAFFKDLLTEMRRVASIKIFNKSVEIDDIVFAKAILYTLDIMERKLIALSKGFVDVAQEQGRER